MDISLSMVKHYLDDVTVGWFDDHDLPPENVADYLPRVLEMKKGAAKHGDLEALKLAFEHILANRRIDCEILGGGRYPFDDKDVREIIAFAWKTIWPDARPIPPGGPPGVRLIEMPLEQWRASRGQGKRP